MDDSTLSKIYIAEFITAITVPLLLVIAFSWVFFDARKRGKPGYLIALLVMLSLPMGLFVWLLARPEINTQDRPTPPTNGTD